MIFSTIYRNVRRLYLVARMYIGGSNFPLFWGLKYLDLTSYDNQIMIKSHSMGDVYCRMYGSGHKLVIDDGVVFKKGVLFFEDHNCSICIHSKTTIEDAEIAAAENNHYINIGSDCMLSSRIRICTTDSHSIIDISSNVRINPARNIVIDDHVWIGFNVTVCKGVHINRDSIIGSNAVVTHDIPINVVAAGIPAKVISYGVNWNRKRLEC